MTLFQTIANKVRSSNLLKSFSIYVFSTFFNQGINFLLLPLFTHYLSPSDYGILSLVNTTISVVTIFIMAGADGAIRRKFYKSEGQEYASFFSSSFFNCILSFFVISILFLITAGWLGPLLQLPTKWLLLSPLISLTSILPTILLGQYRVQQRAASFGIFSNVMTLASLALSIWLVAGAGMNYEGRMYGVLIVNLAFFGASFLILRHERLLTSLITKKHMLSSLRYGLPIIPHQLGALIISFSDRFFIANMVGIDEAGIYNIGYSIAGVISILEGTFTLAYTPFLFEQLTRKTPASDARVIKVSYLFVLSLAVSVIILYLSSGWIFRFFIDKRFASGQSFVLLVAVGYFFSGCYKMLVGYIFFASKTIYLTYLSLVNIVLNLTLNYFLIKSMGAMGAAVATAASYFFTFCITAFVAYRLHPMPWFSTKLSKG